MSELDATDRRILTVLQKEGRITNAELSERVNLSPSACHRRVARLKGPQPDESALEERVCHGLPPYLPAGRFATRQLLVKVKMAMRLQIPFTVDEG